MFPIFGSIFDGWCCRTPLQKNIFLPKNFVRSPQKKDYVTVISDGFVSTSIKVTLIPRAGYRACLGTVYPWVLTRAGWAALMPAASAIARDKCRGYLCRGHLCHAVLGGPRYGSRKTHFLRFSCSPIAAEACSGSRGRPVGERGRPQGAG